MAASTSNPVASIGLHLGFPVEFQKLVFSAPFLAARTPGPARVVAILPAT
jgi:hypothetical protein